MRKAASPSTAPMSSGPTRRWHPAGPGHAQKECHEHASGKKGLIIGIANEHSLAYGCARHFRAAGAELAITYLNTKSEPSAGGCAAERHLHAVRRHRAGPARAFMSASQRTGGGSISYSIRSLMLARKICKDGLQIARRGFTLAMQVSVQSFLRMAKLSEPLMTTGGCFAGDELLRRRKGYRALQRHGPCESCWKRRFATWPSNSGLAGIRVNALSPVR